MPIDRIPNVGIESGAIAPSNLSTGGPAWDSSGNVGIGTSSPAYKLDVVGTVSAGAVTVGIRNFSNTANSDAKLYIEAYSNSRFSYTQYGVNGVGSWNTGYDVASGAYKISNDGGGSLNTNTRLMIDSSGTLFIGATSSPIGTQRLVLTANGGAGTEPMLFNELRATAATENYVRFYRNGSQVGSITNTLSATAYVTSSDYRLKENVQPMTGALAKITQLKPCTYTWKLDGSDGQGFIAHELAEVVPDAVSGEKDAVNEDNSIKPQGIDTSFLVATLTAAIQELKAEVDALRAQVEAK